MDRGLQGGTLQAGALRGEGLVRSLGDKGCREAGMGVRGARWGGRLDQTAQGSECQARSWGHH